MPTPKRFYEHINPNINKNFFDVNPDKPAVWKVYSLYFSILIQKRYTFDENEIRNFGVVTSGSQEEDEAEMNTRVKWKQSIIQMAKLCDKGITFGMKPDQFILLDLEQSVIVYNLITDTLTKILDALRTQVHYDTKDFPLDDIKLLDAFAEQVWKWARTYYKTAEQPEKLDLSPYHQRKYAARRVLIPKGPKQQVPVEKIPETHQPITPLITAKLKIRG